MKELTLQELKEIEFDILKFFDAFCKENNIKLDESWFLHIKKDGYVFKPITKDSEWFDLLLKHNQKLKEKYNGKNCKRFFISGVFFTQCDFLSIITR